jgi:NAD(P)-dependent dehydrogenase (short-subunit alcohol dehydrogenase family)
MCGSDLDIERGHMNRLHGRVAFVTGAAHGIGRATAHRLANEGAQVALADIDIPALKAVNEELRSNDRQSFIVECDVTNRESVAASIDTTIAKYAHLDILVNTAGGASRQPSFEDATDAMWLRDIELNLVGVMRCVQSALPYLKESAFGGSVVTISSVNGIAAFGGYSYSAAKAGLELLTRNFAAEYGHEGIRFNVIAPGTIRTRVWEDQPGSIERLSRMYPLGRIGEPDDIAAGVAFLASDDAAWITGITLPIDGGVLAGPASLTRRDE